MECLLSFNTLWLLALCATYCRVIFFSVQLPTLPVRSRGSGGEQMSSKTLKVKETGLLQRTATSGFEANPPTHNFLFFLSLRFLSLSGILLLPLFGLLPLVPPGNETMKQ